MKPAILHAVSWTAYAPEVFEHERERPDSRAPRHTAVCSTHTMESGCNLMAALEMADYTLFRVSKNTYPVETKIATKKSVILFFA